MRKKYSSDLSDKEWQIIEPLFQTDFSKGGRPLKYSKKEILNAILYVLRSGCTWRDLPGDFPPWATVYMQFKCWKNKRLFEDLNKFLRKKVRLNRNRDEDPSAGIVDSQSVKTTEKRALQAMMQEKKLREENVIYWLTLKDF